MAQVPYTPGQTTVIIQQPTHLSDNSQQMVCPRCNRVVMSKTDSKWSTSVFPDSILLQKV
ncbi:hypothetical protein ACTXT7_014581 [Hymenolepis weldensis]